MAPQKSVQTWGDAITLYIAYYNFVRIHGTLKRTPAMAAGVTDRLWSLEEPLTTAAEK